MDTNILWGQGSENKDQIPKIIWIYWDPIKDSPLVDICLQQIQILHPDYKVNIVNKDTLSSFLQNVPQKNDALPFANYSDIIRLALLEKYGGIWIDASILITNNLDWVFNFKNDYKTDVIGFFADFITTDLDFPILETWFLAASKNNHFIKDWYYEYLSCYTSDNPEVYYKDIPQEWIQGIDENLAKYLICYISAIKTMRTNHKYRLLMFSANDHAHYYNFKLKLKPHQLAEEFLLNENAKYNLPLVKFERRGREMMDDFINKGLLSKKSLLYKLSPNPSKKYSSLQYKLYYIKYIFNNLLNKITTRK
ncbi:glycosyltransferase family 32 protein [Chryseobacterium mulctrae]|uniref:glycosyltransferase family 32 protein n=1 Tax=Chryseobacterium mulctrae TaxID=2576777 RepID=UPI001115E811|nr:capsular polysaccharide synthesis protein [Chryseobacterium mulctrae]